MWADLLREMDIDHSDNTKELDGHFLGSIVLHPATGAASVLMQHLVIDGQQRLTTILILLAALRDIRAEVEPDWDPREYDTKYLTNPYDPEHPNRLVPTELDRAAYVETTRRKNPTEGIGQAYTFFDKRIRELHRHRGGNLSTLGDTLLLHMLVVEINTSSGDSVNNIFNTLNSKGRPLTAADLVRNELLLHVGEEQSRIAYERFWLPMEHALVIERKAGFDDREFVTFLWSREVAYDAKSTRQDLFPTFERRLRRELDTLPSALRRDKAMDVFEEMYNDHLLFLYLRDPRDEYLRDFDISDELAVSLDRLRQWGSEPSTPLALWLLRAAKRGEIDQIDAAEAVDVLIGYLGRRALAGVPTNLLNRILTPIASRLSTRRDGSAVDSLRSILNAPGSYWPPDAEVLLAAASQPIYVSAKRQVKFLLAEAERILSARPMDALELAAKHVMPPEISRQWEQELVASGFDLDDARALYNTLGNLTLADATAVMSHESLEESLLTLQPSSLRLNEDLALSLPFTPIAISERSRRLAKALLTAFPGPSVRQDIVDERAHSGAAVSDRIENALQAMPEGSWTSEDDLVEFLGIDLQELRSLVSGLDSVIARLVRDASGSMPTWFSDELSARVAPQFSPGVAEGRVSSALLAKLVRDIEQALDEGDADEAGVA